MLPALLAGGSAMAQAQAQGVKVYGSVYGGGNLAVVNGSTTVNVGGGTIGTAGQGGATYGNVYGGGKGQFKDENNQELEASKAVQSGLVKGNTTVTIHNGTILHNIYGGGAYGSVGEFDYADADYNEKHPEVAIGMPYQRKENTTGGTATVTITGGTIGTTGKENGMVFGSSRGDVDAPGNIQDKQAWVYDTHVTIGTSGQGTAAPQPQIKGSVYGGGENGHTYHDAEVIVHSGTIGIAEGSPITTNDNGTPDDPSDDTTLSGAAYPYRGNVYGAGCGTDKYYSDPDNETYDGNGQLYNPLAGIVQGNTTVTIDGGHVVHNVYGAGAMGSVGTVTNQLKHKGTQNSVVYTDGTGVDEKIYGFGLSWPVEFTYAANTGSTTISISNGAEIGVDGVAACGHVFGAARGAVEVGESDITKQRYVEAYLANVRTASITIGTASGTQPTIHGSVYGGGEDGHVYEDATVTINGGAIAHSVFGGGKGEGTYETYLWINDQNNQGQNKPNAEAIHSWTAGKVYGNTTVTMNGGSVGYNIYGGGNLASVGKGSYSGGIDDYSTTGYGEQPRKDGTAEGPLWTANPTEGTDAWHFANSGISTVNIYGGIVGTNTGSDSDGMPYGNVFGGSRGKAASSGRLSPRYRYNPDFFLGYVNKAVVNIGDDSEGDGPTIKASVFGGGQDGHTRNSAQVTIKKGTIGIANDTNVDRGNVFGSGSGIGKYDANNDGTEDACNYSSGSVTCTTQIDIEGGTIYRNVYGGGALSSVGPPNTGQKINNIAYDEIKELNANTGTHKSVSYTKVNIKGGAISGSVYGASRGPSDAIMAAAFGGSDANHTYDSKKFATVIWSDVNVTGAAAISGSVYGGGEKGIVKHATNVNIGIPAVGETAAVPYTGTIAENVFGGGKEAAVGGNITVNLNTGTINKDVYGGGALANTNTNTDNGDTTGAKVTDNTDALAISGETNAPTTTVNLLGGKINGDAYGGGLGQLAKDAVAGEHYTQEEIAAATEGDPAYGKTTLDWKVEPASAVTAIPATVAGDIFVNLGGTATAEAASATSFDISYLKDNKNNDVVNSGRVFGCNNLNGSPKGDVTVTVWKTVAGTGASGKTDPSKINSETESDHIYQLAAVYGGGNLASFTETGKTANVIIHGCDKTSILTVYGGGNAAPVPNTNVAIYGTYEIGAVFGGGNGKDKYTLDGGTTWNPNPGADVGESGNTTDGNATTMIYGGTVHEAYGGSNKKGTIYGTVTIDVGSASENIENCTLNVGKIVGAGKNADIEGDLKIVMGCKPNDVIPLVFGGADDANVNGDVELTITSGHFGKVFGGNNMGGIIKGHIKLNIEETGKCAIPITIDELYLGGNQAMYSMWGYYEEGDEYKPRTGPNDSHTAEAGIHTPNATDGYGAPELNIISCTSIGQVFGGGLGTRASMYANPIVNINMLPGDSYGAIDRDNNGTADNKTHALGEIGDVFGGGNQATVYGNTTVNIGTATTVLMTSLKVADLSSAQEFAVGTDNYNRYQSVGDDVYGTVQGAYISGDVYGGGNLANVTGNTFVNICANKTDDTSTADIVEYTSKTYDGTDFEGVVIKGSVYGGGKGLDDTFLCEKAMIGTDGAGVDADYNDITTYLDGNTHVIIGNGTVEGSVYGGGMIGRVEKNTTVTIGTELTETGKTSAPDIKGNVFGGGKGKKTHGYAALVRGNPTVTIQADAKVGLSVYGAGEIASVARYKVPKTEEEVNQAHAAGYTEAQLGMPYALANTTTRRSGYCTVTVKGNAEIGPDGMKMVHPEITDGSDKPDDTGYVFAAGKGFLPTVYTYSDTINKPKRMVLYDESVHTAGTQGTDWEYYDKADSEHNKNVWEYFKNETDYIKFIQTQALASYTEVTIDENAFVKGAVYGGSENGLVQFDTKVYIKGGQIGCGKNKTARHPDDVWADNYTPLESDNLECESWDYGKVEGTGENQTTVYASYDPNANATGDLEKYPKVAGLSEAQSTQGGRRIATDGHTYYGNVFGGGSGSIPYFDTNTGISKYLNTAGMVKGNTYVEITGGHILTNVYGGCEATNVLGDSKVVMRGGTLGVPRTENQIKNHPVTCYLFGAGKGDQRIYFNKDTNVKNAEVEVDGGRIYGSVFGGAEDGHVLGNTKVTIKQTSDSKPTKIGNYGTTYVDGNIFGGGRGFAGDSYTAGNVSGSVEVDIKGGTMLGSVYGGGRLASVGYGLYLVNESGYGLLRKDNTLDDGSTTTDFSRGHVTINISGGTIGNDYEYIMPTSTNIPTGLSPDISTWSKVDWTTWKTHNHVPLTEYDDDGKLLHTKGGNVFAGGMGRREDLNGKPIVYNANDPTSINWHKLGNVKQTKVTISGTAWIKSNVYGGGELGAVRSYYEGSLSNPTEKQGGTTEVTIEGGTIGTLMGPSVAAGGTKDLTVLSSMSNADHDKCYTFGNVFGGGSGTEKDITESNKYTRDMEIYAALVIDGTKVSMTGGRVLGSVYGGGEVACVGGNTKVEVKGDSKIGVNEVRKDTYKTNYVLFGSWRMGNVYGGGRGSEKAFMAGLVMGNTTVDISGTAGIYHNVYGGGAIGSVGLFNLAADDTSAGASVLGGTPTQALSTSTRGKAKVTITGTPTIGINGWDNGMVNGSSRGDVTTPILPTGYAKKFDIYDRLGWVNETEVIIGTANDVTAGPIINGSVYGGGENGHNLGDSHVTVNSGTIGYSGYNFANPTYECGNVFGAGCGTDTYDYDSDNDGTDETYYNFLAGIVRGNTYVTINGGTVRHNVYGAGSMASVGQTNASGAITGNGATTIVMTGGTVGVDGNKNGSIFGGSRGSETSTQKPLSQVKSTSVSISGSNTIVKGNVYGGGESGDVGTYTYNSTTKNYTWDQVSNTQIGDCTVSITGGTIGTDGNTATGHVFGGGKGVANTFQCDKAMARTTSVSVSGSTTKVKGNVYGGGEVGRVDQNTVVTIGNGDNEGAGTASGTDVEISGNVFGAGAGKETHGYSALVRGNATVTVQGNAQVGKNVYGGGEIAAVGRYGLDGSGMPNTLVSGGECTVTVKGYAEIGYKGTGHVFGAGMGVTPHYYMDVTSYSTDAEKPYRMNASDGTEYFNTRADYLNFLQTLALATDTYVTINGNAKVNGSVYGGSQNGFVQRNADVKIQGSSMIVTTETDTDNNPMNGHVYGGGKGFSGFDEAGRVRGDATTTISGGSIAGNVYGGGELGIVGKYNTTDHNTYTWDKIHEEDTHASGLCTVTIDGATASVGHDVYGGGKGEAVTFRCEPAMSRETIVNISAGTVSGTVYGGGEIGRVDGNTTVTIGVGDGTAAGDPSPVIGQDVFGAGKGLETHGYSALVRGNTTVTVQGNAKVVKNVYGGGKIASVGRYGLDGKQFPSILQGGGECTVTVKGYAKIGDSEGHVFGAGRGVTPHYYTNGVTSYSNNADKPKRMLTYTAAAVQGKEEDVDWAYFEQDHTYIWDYLNSKAEYDNYLQTLALATKPMVTIEGHASVNGDVYGGGERGITKGCVEVTIQGNASIARDVYGGGALADTQVANWKDGEWAWTTTSNHEHKTTVNLHGGTIGRNVFGGGLGQKAKAALGTEPAVEAIPAYVYGDVLVELNKTTATDNCVVKGEIYGANNLNGSPKRDVTVHIYKTQGWTDDKGTADTSDDVDHDVTAEKLDNTIAKPGIYELKTVYGGGNEASYIPVESSSESHKTNVIIEGCDLTSIETVYGGGDAASAPATFVNVKSCYEIGTLFAGGNGKDNLEDGSLNFGAHVGYKPAVFTSDPSLTPEENFAGYQTAFDAQKASLAYGIGEAVAKLEGGTIHTAFGGSNTRGNVRVSGLVDLNEPTNNNTCPLCIDEVYGAGNEADQDGTSNINMGCISYLQEIYGGAKNADVNDNVELTIQSGRFERVFGGNNLGGCIRGSITVNIEETGCHPIVIGQLYGGGNLAGYSVRGYKQVTENEKLVWKPCEPTDNMESGMTAAFANPQVNVKSFTSIGEIFGGGYGAPAVMVGSPTVNINEVEGSSSGSTYEAPYYDTNGNFMGWTPEIEGKQVSVPTHEAGKIGAIGRVFGGGNAANILGDTNVKVGTDEYVYIQESNITAGTTTVDNFYTRNTDGTYSQASGTAQTGTTYYSRHAVLGVDIRGNVFGGGNQAEVHGNTNVTIGQ